jgi:hypothetical protein
MVALWGFCMIGYAKFSEYRGVTVFSGWKGPIYRDQDPDSFRKAVAVQKVIGVLAILGWFINLNWPSVFR